MENQKALILFAITIFTVFYQVTNATEQLNYQPVIGVYTQPSQWTDYPPPKYQYILENFVQYLQQAGALVVAVPFDASEDTLREIFYSINGLLFTGGSLNISIDKPLPYRNETYNIYTKNAAFLIDLAIESNQNGDYFPIWGTCQGFELLNYIISGFHYDVLESIEHDQNVSRNGYFIKESHMYQTLSDELFKYAQAQEPLFLWHELTVTAKAYENYEQLRNFFTPNGYSVNSTSILDPDAMWYITSVEANDYPFYAVQYHPEIQQFEWKFNTNKNLQAYQISQHLANFFVEQARKNFHKYDTVEDLERNLIQNFQPVHINQSDMMQIIFLTQNDFPPYNTNNIPQEQHYQIYYDSS